MMNPAALSRSVSRFRLTKYFPGSDQGIIDALAAELARLASSDEELAELTERSIKASGGDWPGLAGIHEAARELVRERKADSAKAEARAARDAHELKCPGFSIRVDEKSKTLSVALCRENWTAKGFITIGSGPGVIGSYDCRVAGRLLNEGCLCLDSIEAEELSKRPGWTKDPGWSFR